MMRLGLLWGVDRDEVGLGQQAVQRNVGEAEFLFFTLCNSSRSPVEDAHREATSALGDRAADATAAADESNGLAPGERSLEADRLRSRKYVAAEQAIAFDDPARDG